MGLIGCLEASVRNYLFSLRNNPEERSSQVFLCSVLSKCISLNADQWLQLQFLRHVCSNAPFAIMNRVNICKLYTFVSICCHNSHWDNTITLSRNVRFQPTILIITIARAIPVRNTDSATCWGFHCFISLSNFTFIYCTWNSTETENKNASSTLIKINVLTLSSTKMYLSRI